MQFERPYVLIPNATVVWRLIFAIALTTSSALVDARQLGWPGKTLSGVQCYGIGQGVGPFNYVTQRSAIGIVEEYHFKPEHEGLADGISISTGKNLDYTLRAVPNHHRALWAMVRWYLLKLEYADRNEIETLERLREGLPPPECYFHRAKSFVSKDGMVPAIFGIYLHKRGKLDEALAEYSLAENLAPNHAELAYNIGLLYFDMDNLEKAREYADRAEKLGYPLRGLKTKIDKQEAGSGA
jgi:tetratricopeptide (TPR) repeat protein